MVPFGSVVTAEDDAGVYTDVRNPLIRPVLVSTVKLYIVSVALEKHTESASWSETVLYTPVEGARLTVERCCGAARASEVRRTAQ